MSLAWQAGLRKHSDKKASKNWDNTLKLVYKPIIRHYRKRSVVSKISIDKTTSEKVGNPVKMSGNLTNRWKVKGVAEINSNVDWVDMIDRTISDQKQISKEIVNGPEQMMSEPEPNWSNKKNKCGLLICSLLIALSISVPIVSVTLYNFVSCFQSSQKLGEQYLFWIFGVLNDAFQMCLLH